MTQLQVARRALKPNANHRESSNLSLVQTNIGGSGNKGAVATAPRSGDWREARRNLNPCCKASRGASRRYVFGDAMTVSELIEKLDELKRNGCGEMQVVVNDCKCRDIDYELEDEIVQDAKVVAADSSYEGLHAQQVVRLEI